MGKPRGCTAVSNKSCAVMSLRIRLIGTCCCPCVSLHLTLPKVPQLASCLLTFFMVMSLPCLLNMPYVPSLTALFRLFLILLLVCRLQWSWFVLLWRVPLRLCLCKPISITVRYRLWLVCLHGYQLSIFG